MARAMSVRDRAIEIASEIEGRDCETSHDWSDRNRHEFSYEGGCIQAHKLPDGWEFVGFGKRWFALRQE